MIGLKTATGEAAIFTFLRSTLQVGRYVFVGDFSSVNAGLFFFLLFCPDGTIVSPSSSDKRRER